MNLSNLFVAETDDKIIHKSRFCPENALSLNKTAEEDGMDPKLWRIKQQVSFKINNLNQETGVWFCKKNQEISFEFFTVLRFCINPVNCFIELVSSVQLTHFDRSMTEMQSVFYCNNHSLRITVPTVLHRHD